jgi:hypothetical protein
MLQDTSKHGRKQCTAAEAQYRGLDHGAGSALSHRETQGVYATALSTQRLNAVGIFDEYGDELGCVLAPLAAMVNHSCLPNCQVMVEYGQCRLVALRDIAAGEELSYSYVSLQGGEEDRKRSIKDTWQFSCRCERCCGEVDCSAFDWAHVCYCGSVCVAVERSAAEECVCNTPKIRVGATEAV